MKSRRVTLRELRPGDAPSLLATLTTDIVARFISAPPATAHGFDRFIAWAHREQIQGHYVCFAVVPAGTDEAVGVFQLRSLEADFSTAEWGFAMGADYWGSGLFLDAAVLVLDFAFGVIGVHRLEARAAVDNARGNGALRKIGAVQEVLLRRSFARDGESHNQGLWSILAEDWWMRRQADRRRGRQRDH